MATGPSAAHYLGFNSLEGREKASQGEMDQVGDL